MANRTPSSDHVGRSRKRLAPNVSLYSRTMALSEDLWRGTIVSSSLLWGNGTWSGAQGEESIQLLYQVKEEIGLEQILDVPSILRI